MEATTPAGLMLNVIDPTSGSVVELPAPTRDPSVTPYARGGRLYYVALDADDVQSIQVLTLKP